MKTNKLKKKSKKNNIPLRRNFALIYYRLVSFAKFITIIILGLFLFTNYLSFVNQGISNTCNELLAKVGFELENVIIEGEKNVSRQDIVSTLNADTGTPIFNIKLEEVKKQLEQKLWIKKAVVERQLPNTIYVKILERVPIAIWQVNQKLHLIDNEGHKIINTVPDKFSNLPHLVGTDANIYAESLIKDLNNFPNILKKMQSAVRYGERRWNLNLEQNITVKMPEENFIAALRYLDELNKVEKLFNSNLKVIDLRNSNKLYIEKLEH
ncbi:MAG: FtsQ-type POTRA domain-containing protein [Rickettsiaceae bacterium]|nr:MAG: FtsQ-type POTRA domain-containing protein [Rickettsiaceae bacterium]